jgi:hypothetical protein
MQKIVENELKRLAKELGIDYQVLEAVYTSQFKFLKERLNENDKDNKDSFVNVRFKYFGTLRFNEKKYDRVCRDRQKKLTCGDSKEQ